MKKIELLAPCGNYDALLAAVNFGADAVFLAANRFGARGYADNFSYEELREAIRYCHIRNVRVYVTMNILVYENEMEEALKQVDFLYKNDVDAIIIQDLGLLEVVSKMYPDLELHASTQMHIHNKKGAEFITEKGISRVVIARETPLDVIKSIADTGIDVEVFSYGALCVSYSGQCLMSSVFKNRSGNRGVCSQLCRMPYKILDLKTNTYLDLKDEYLLSMKDLNTIEKIPQLIEAGAGSLKIEGRMKRYEYVAYVVSVYRQAIDAYYNGEKFSLSDIQNENLKKLFYRGFTEGFTFNTKSENIVNPKRPNHIGVTLGKIVKIKGNMKTIELSHDLHQHDGLRIISKNKDIGLIANRIYKDDLLVNSAVVGERIEMDISDYCNINDEVVLTSDYLQLQEIAREFKNTKKKIDISISLKLLIGQRAELIFDDGKNKVTIDSDLTAQKAEKQPLDKDKIIKAVSGLGNTVYTNTGIDLNLDDNIFFSMKELKNMRRKAADKLDESRALNHSGRTEAREYKADKIDIELTNHDIYEIDNINQFQENALNFSNNKNIVSEDVRYKTNVSDHYDNDNSSSFISQIGNLKNNVDFIAGSSFNIVNSYALKFLFDNSASMVILSDELNDKQLKVMLSNFKNRFHTKANVAIMNKGRRVLMILRYNSLLKYSYPDYQLKLEDNLMYIKADSNNNMLIMESEAYQRNIENDDITNKYYRLNFDDRK